MSSNDGASQTKPGTCDYWDLEVFRNVKSRGSGSPSVLTFASIFVPGGKGVYILRYLITGWWLKRKLLSASSSSWSEIISLGATQIHQSMAYLRCFHGPIFTANASDLPCQVAVNTRCQVKLNLATPCLLCRGLRKYP